MTGGIDQIDQEAAAVSVTLLLDELDVFLGHFEVHRNGAG